MNRHFLEQLKELIPEEEFFLDESMKQHTTFRIGGNAECLITPDRQQLQEVLFLAKTENVPVTVIGNGSNLLVRDGGIEGLVVEIGKAMSDIRRAFVPAIRDCSQRRTFRTGICVRDPG
jgi:UDP-N-acetylmuramate dehydrogenase